jgi:LytS/YehU family sensor histidine kinase
MIRDRNLRLGGILVTGMLLPLAAGLINPADTRLLLPAFLYFLLSAFLSWQCTVFLYNHLRQNATAFAIRLLLSVLMAATSGVLIANLSFYLWQRITEGTVTITFYANASLIAAAVNGLIVLCYEILHLHAEKIIDSKVVHHLDRELAEAEMNVLRNELDPHFVYNSLMPLYYLIKNDGPKAEAFACKLIQVYQYFLQNRQKDVITLDEELQFISNYFFLLRIRYKDAIILNVQVKEEERSSFVLPLSLQTLVENVIKHNSGTRDAPVQVNVFTRDRFLVVSNSLHEARDVPSSKVGLKNLRSRYRLLAGRDISVMKARKEFVVELPLLSQNEDYDVRYCHRG